MVSPPAALSATKEKPKVAEQMKKASEGVKLHKWPLLLIVLGLGGLGAGMWLENLPSKLDYASTIGLLGGFLQFWFERQQKKGVGEVKEAVASAATAGVQTAVINLTNRFEDHCNEIKSSIGVLMIGKKENDDRHGHLETRVANLEQGQTEIQEQVSRICGKLGV